MIIMCQHLLPLTAMGIIIAYSNEDEAVAGVVDPILVVGLRREQGITCTLGFSLKAQFARREQTIESTQLDKS